MATSELLSQLGDQTYVDFLSVSQTLEATRSQLRNANAAATATNATRSNAQLQPAANSARTGQPIISRQNSAPASAAAGAQGYSQQHTRTDDNDCPDEAPPPPPPRRDANRTLTKQQSLPAKALNDSKSRKKRSNGRLSSSASSTSRKTWTSGQFRQNGVGVAKHNYVRVLEGDLSINKNDTLEILEDSKQWWLVRNIHTDETGYVPSNHVECKIPVCHDVWDISEENIRDTQDGRIGRHLVIATRDYTAGAHSELSFHKEDSFLVLNTRSKWWFVYHVKSGKEGFIPQMYVRDGDGVEENDNPGDIGTEKSDTPNGHE